MKTHESRSQHLHVNLGGLRQGVKRIIVELTRPGAPPVKPEIVLSGEFENNPLFDTLYTSVTRITDIMSQTNWDPALLAEYSEMDVALEQFSKYVQRIDKEKGRTEARKMLEASLNKLQGTQYFASLPDGEIKQKQVRMTLIKHFEDTFGMPLADSLRPSRL